MRLTVVYTQGDEEIRVNAREGSPLVEHIKAAAEVAGHKVELLVVDEAALSEGDERIEKSSASNFSESQAQSFNESKASAFSESKNPKDIASSIPVKSADQKCENSSAREHEKEAASSKASETQKEQKSTSMIMGYLGDEILILKPPEVACFTIINSKPTAIVGGKEYRIKERIFELEEMLDDSFIKINQSCIVNINKIKKFKTSLGGSLLVELDCGFKDYISRRQLKSVKDRFFR